MKLYGNLVTGCHDCPFSVWDEGCGLDKKIDILTPLYAKKVHNDCPMLQEETHSITIMLSDQYNKDE